jgi:hypothetical protein
MVESDSVNNTLAPYEVCPNANNAEIGGQGSTMAEKWIAVYLEAATKRLASMITGDLTISITDVFEMQLTCAYEVCQVAPVMFLHSWTFFRRLRSATPNFVGCSLKKNGKASNTLSYVGSCYATRGHHDDNSTRTGPTILVRLWAWSANRRRPRNRLRPGARLSSHTNAYYEFQ